MTFTFDASTHRVLLMKGKTAFGSVIFDTTKTAQGGNMHTGI
jgi:flagellar biosynthesis component FlhA